MFDLVLLDSEREFVESALQSDDVKQFFRLWWEFYDLQRERGNLPKIEPTNPHPRASKALLLLVGHAFSIRGAFEEMQENGIDHVLEQYSGDEPMIPAPWETG